MCTPAPLNYESRRGGSFIIEVIMNDSTALVCVAAWPDSLHGRERLKHGRITVAFCVAGCRLCAGAAGEMKESCLTLKLD
jgi:hypothetical protein